MIKLSLHKFLPVWILLGVGFIVLINSDPLAAQGKKEIEILFVNTLKYNRNQGVNMQRLLGDVQIRHDQAYLNCDSAHLYRDSNMVKAYSNVYIWQGDSLKLYGDYLKYSGNDKKARLQGRVKMIDKQTTLETNFLDYDLNTETGTYHSFGTVKNEDNILTSKRGIYYSKGNIFYFKDSVRVKNPDYNIYCDTMSYHTDTKVTSFYGPTEIVSDSNYIYCERGWYDTRNDRSEFSGNALLRNPHQSIRGDTLFYDKGSRSGWGLGGLLLEDTVQKIILKGNYGTFSEDPERTMVTDSALFIQITDNNDSLFLHADTLRSGPDSTGKYKILNAYYGVRLFEPDLQGVCDSLSYSFADSVIRFFYDPCLWSEENQLTGEYVELFTRNKAADRLELTGSAFIISREDSLHYNQIKGKNMTGYFRDNQIYKINVSGNGQTIYFPNEGKGVIGVNYVESSDIILYIKNKKIEKINMIKQPSGKLDPKSKMDESTLKLEDFQWLEIRRPRSVNDLFRK